MKFGASSVYLSMIRSAYCSSSSRCGSSFQSSGTHWLNIENTCTPSGASCLSSVVGIVPSTNGATAALRSMCASWNARSAYCGLKHSSTEPV